MKKYRGFTIIEMLIVVTIIAVLSGLILRGMGGALPRARDSRRLGDLKNIQNMLELYYTKNNTYPSTLSQLATNLNTTIPKDPSTNSDYCYAPLGQTLPNIYTSYVLGVQLEGSASGSVTGLNCGTNTCGGSNSTGGTYYCVKM